MAKPANTGKLKLIGKVKLIIPAGKANPAPPIGSSLGQKGVSAVNFCKEFNEASKAYKENEKLRVLISIYQNKTFSFEIKQPKTSDLLLKELNLQKGCSVPGNSSIAKISMSAVSKIAERKIVDMNTLNLDNAIKMVISTAKSMGIEVIENE